MYKHFFAFLHSCGISQKKLFSIFEQRNNPKEVFENLSIQTLKPYYSNTENIEKILETKKKLDTKYLENIITKQDIKIISFFDSEYPENLKNIANPPFILYVKGNIWNEARLGIIGSRKITQYGEKTIETLIPELSKYFTIVSWWAIGCDTKAHEVAVKGGGKTIVVFGTGIDKNYPAGNSELYKKIVNAWGALVSQFPIWEWPQTYNFPQRNEIISGLSNGILVIEAGEKSGTLITAQLALDQGRDLFVVPWDIFKTNSLGCNNLIKKGEAKMITTLSDILEEYNFLLTNEGEREKKTFQNKQEQDVYNLLILEALTIDELSKKLNIQSYEIAVTLSLLELTNAIRRTQNWTYEVC